MRNDILECKEQIMEWIKENKSKSFIATQLKCKQETLCRYLTIMGIDYKGNQGHKGEKVKSNPLTLAQYLAQSKDIQSYKVRNKILKEGLKPYRCEQCGQTEWLGQPIPLELHHIDGDRTHNELSNYQLLCPNCHALTDSYRGKNCQKNPQVAEW